MLIIHHLFILIITNLLAITESKIAREIGVDIGRNISLPCLLSNKNVMWVHEGKDAVINHLHVLENGSLSLTQVDRKDSGIYTCSVDGVDDASVRLRVRTPPPQLSFTVHPSTILALLIWTVNDTGGYPIIYFTAQYRLGNSDEEWKIISPTRISPNIRQIEVYKLEPNTTYGFQIWATNQLGKGEITEVHEHTLFNNQELELARHFLEGADKFDTRMWLIAVAVVMGTLVLLAFGTCLLLYQECRTPNVRDDQEIIELVPNIILNPGFDTNTTHTERIPADENSNNDTTVRLNNNTVIQPRNV